MQNMWLTATSFGLGFQLISQACLLAKSDEFLTLLGLPSGSYVIDGCVVGFPKEDPAIRKEIDLADYVTWV